MEVVFIYFILEDNFFKNLEICLRCQPSLFYIMILDFNV